MKNLITLTVLIVVTILFNSCGEQKHVKGGYLNCSAYYYEYNDGKLDEKSKALDFTCKINKNGKIIEERYYPHQHSGCESFHKYTYDKRGNMIEDLSLEPNGSISFKRTYKYDKNDRYIECISYDSSGKVRETYSKKYDKSGNTIELVTTDSLGNIKYKNTYKYDKFGNKIEEITYNTKNDPVEKTEYIYSK